MTPPVDIPQTLRDKYRHYGEKWSDKKIELPDDKMFYEVVAIMRGNPPHANHTAMLRELCSRSVKLKLNLGSSNKFDKKNPFKIEEREEMMALALGEYNNYELLRLPDVGNDEQWFKNLWKVNKSFTEIMSNNQSDLNIYRKYQFEKDDHGIKTKKYDILSPTDVLDSSKMIYVKGILQYGAIFKATKKPMYVSGTFVRAAMVNDWNWEDFVDQPVAEYIRKNNLVERVKEFCPELDGITLEKLDDGR